MADTADTTKAKAMTVDSKKSEIGPQRREDANGRLLHCCCVCRKVERWGSTWSFYGSYQDEEDGVALPKFCSAKCQNAGGPEAAKITEEMRLAAREAEWREPTIAYREMTDKEKYLYAADSQKKARAVPVEVAWSKRGIEDG